MWQRFGVSLVLAVTLFAPACNRGRDLGAAAPPLTWARCGPSVAHALGGIDSFVYTNSREAFERSYARGFRVFELDLRHTADGALVLAHDWETPSRQPAAAAASLQAFESTPIYSRYTPLTAAAALELLRASPGTRFLLDLKEGPRRILPDLVRMADAIDPTVLDRTVPIAYSVRDLEAIARLHRFPSVAWSLHYATQGDAEILKAVQGYRVQLVVTNQFQFRHRLTQELRRRGVAVYVSTVNAVGQESVFREWGASGVFTDVLPPDSACPGQKSLDATSLPASR